jgi:glycosyltransferase involved in cell wall biosynthesis
MISVLTLTYKRHHILEEAIESFLRQDGIDFPVEMVVINDNPDVDYIIGNPGIRIINHKTRFPSIGRKLEFGYKQCKYPYVYRLDDDDLLTPWGLKNAHTDIMNNPGFDIYRSSGFYLYDNNVYIGESGSVNNGNIYSREYLERINWPDKSGDEDSDITFDHNGKIYQSSLKHTMIYRWGMNTLHISGMGKQPNEVVLHQADKVLDSTQGEIRLFPNFVSDHYKSLP